MKIFTISFFLLSSIIGIYPSLSFSKVYKSNSSKKIILSKRMINIELLRLFAKKNKVLGKKVKLNAKKISKKIKSYGAYSIPVLLKVMKDKGFTDKSKWMATFLLGQVAGKKSEGVLLRFTKHPSWVLRLASLRTLFSLNSKKLEKVCIKLIKDPSWLIRDQALDIINTYGFEKASAHVWAMLYNKKNYNGRKRGAIIKKVITTIGDLHFQKALKPLLIMSQNKKYKDIFSEIDYSLSLITGKKSPRGNKIVKKRYWKSIQLSNTII